MSDLEEVFNSAIEKSDKCGECGTITARIGGDSQAKWCCNCGAKLRGNHIYATTNIPPRAWEDDKKQYVYKKMPASAEVPMPEAVGLRFDGTSLHKEVDVRTYGDAREAAGYARAMKEAGRDAERYREALQRLACLGNGDRFGNSIGNVIAQDALRGEVK